MVAILIFAVSSGGGGREHHHDDPDHADPWHDLDPHPDLRVRRRWPASCSPSRRSRCSWPPMVLLRRRPSMGGGFYVAIRRRPARGCTQNLFWLMGHPEVYVILIPAVAALMELTAVFARKPLYSYTDRGAVHHRHRRPERHGVGAPHVRLGLGPGSQRPVHADDGDDLHPDRWPVPGHPGHHVARSDLGHVADDVHLRDALELHHRRDHRHLPLRRAAGLRSCTGRCS